LWIVKTLPVCSKPGRSRYSASSEAGLPVVGVDDVRPQDEQPTGLHHGPAEEAEPGRVVAIIAVRVAVELRAVEELRLVDEQNGHVRPGQGSPEDLPRDESIPDPNLQRQPVRIDRTFAAAGLELRVVRDDERDGVAGRRERLGERARHVGEAARL
jgi:hypothetical protein